MKVLLADDEKTYRTAVVWECNKHGIDITCANHGGEAIELLSKETFDLVLLDYLMPIKSGLEVAKFMTEQGIKTPIFMISAMEDSTFLQKRETGIQLFIKKGDLDLKTLPNFIKTIAILGKHA